MYNLSNISNRKVFNVLKDFDKLEFIKADTNEIIRFRIGK